MPLVSLSCIWEPTFMRYTKQRFDEVFRELEQERRRADEYLRDGLHPWLLTCEPGCPRDDAVRGDGAVLPGAVPSSAPRFSSPLRTLRKKTTKRRTQKRESPMVCSTAYPSRYLPHRLLNARSGDDEDAVVGIGLRYPPTLL